MPLTQKLGKFTTTMAADSADDATKAVASSKESKIARSIRAQWMLTFVVVAAVTAIAVVAYLVIGWVQSDSDAEKSQAHTRDNSRRTAEQVVLNFSNLDPNDIEGLQRRSASVMTGDLLAQMTLENLRARVEKFKNTQIAAGKKPEEAWGKLESKIAGSAVTEIVSSSATEVLVYAEITLFVQRNVVSSTTSGFRVSMVKKDSTWRANKIIPLEGIEVTPS